MYRIFFGHRSLDICEMDNKDLRNPNAVVLCGMAAILSRISLAAFFVKVRAMTVFGFAPWARMFAILQVRTLVFPLPAPAIISEGPSIHLTASS